MTTNENYLEESEAMTITTPTAKLVVYALSYRNSSGYAFQMPGCSNVSDQQVAVIHAFMEQENNRRDPR